ncbi:UNVERIFIED_CONTAM: hypothetical protein NCL1_04035 [Trichonephila clavipes]
MSRRKQRSAFDQVYEFDRGRILWRIFQKNRAPLHVRTGTDRPVTSRTVAQHTESETHHSVSARSIQRCLQQSDVHCLGSTLDSEPQTSPPPKKAMKEGYRWQKGIKLSLLTSHASVCNSTMVRFESGDTVERGC